MKYFCSETLEEVKVVREPFLTDEPSFNVHYPNGYISYHLEKRHIDNGFFRSKKKAIVAHNDHLKHRIKFHQEEITKLVKEMKC